LKNGVASLAYDPVVHADFPAAWIAGPSFAEGSAPAIF